VEVPKVDLSIESEQYQQAMLVKHTFDTLNRMQLLLPYKPQGRPTAANARDWWHYAILCVKKPTTKSGITEVPPQPTNTRGCVVIATWLRCAPRPLPPRLRGLSPLGELASTNDPNGMIVLGHKLAIQHPASIPPPL
jgi:hypothetical protein